MKKGTLAVAMATAFVAVSCIKDEPRNEEADIERAWISVSSPDDVFFAPSDSVVDVMSTDAQIVFSVRRTADLKALAPQFRLTPGATIDPPSGSVRDFAGGPVDYTVTSEAGAQRRTYSVAVRHVSLTEHFDFEDFYFNHVADSSFYEWCEVGLSGDSSKVWASGNLGFYLTDTEAKPDSFPTTVLRDGYEGNGVRLTTRSTGDFGVMFKMPIAAGNLFLGSFDLANALVSPLSATRFGAPLDYRPARFTGMYKYTPGEVFTNRELEVVEGVTDETAIYAVVYRNQDAEGNSLMLDGTNVLTSPQLVATAEMREVPPVGSWTEFDIPFSYIAEPDPATLANRGYNLAVVFSSSKKGDTFEGAVGSTLCIDKVTVTRE